QAAGNPVDARTDVYSTGVVLHEMLTGRRPSRLASPRVTSNRPKLPATISTVLDKCLMENLEARYASGVELEAALARVGGMPGRSVWAVALGVALTMAAGTVAAERYGISRSSVPRAVAVPSAPTSDAPTVVNHLNEPPPSTTNPEAL